MYRYDEFDQRFVAERAAQFRDQAQRRLAGELTEDEFRPLAADERPLSAAPCLYAAHRHSLWHAVVAPDAPARRRSPSKYDRGYGHFTTRQNIQFNWIKLEDSADILADACRGRDARHPDLRQLHPQRHRPTIGRAPPPTRSPIRGRWPSCCANGRASIRNSRYLPRKFKIAVTGAPNDRAAIKVHDIGLQHASRTTKGESGWEVIVGGGLGRTPMVGIDDPRLPAGARAAALSRGDHARLQSAWPARQQVQGAHQDPGPRARRGRIHARRSRRNSRSAIRTARSSCRRRARADRGLFRAAGFRDACRRVSPPSSSAKLDDPRLRPLGRAQCRRRTSSRAMRSSTSR